MVLIVARAVLGSFHAMVFQQRIDGMHAVQISRMQGQSEQLCHERKVHGDLRTPSTRAGSHSTALRLLEQSVPRRIGRQSHQLGGRCPHRWRVGPTRTQILPWPGFHVLGQDSRRRWPNVQVKGVKVFRITINNFENELSDRWGVDDPLRGSIARLRPGQNGLNVPNLAARDGRR